MTRGHEVLLPVPSPFQAWVRQAPAGNMEQVRGQRRRGGLAPSSPTSGMLPCFRGPARCRGLRVCQSQAQGDACSSPAQREPPCRLTCVLGSAWGCHPFPILGLVVSPFSLTGSPTIEREQGRGRERRGPSTLHPSPVTPNPGMRASVQAFNHARELGGAGKGF